MDSALKVYKPKSAILIFSYIFASTLVSSMLVSLVIVFIYFMNDIGWVIILLSSVSFGLYMGISGIIALSCKKIVLDVDAIRVKKDKRGGFRVLQHEINLPYADINSIEIVVSATDTNGEGQLGLFTPMPSIYFECSNDEFRMINVYDYSKKQIIEMLDEIIKRAQAVGKLLNCLTGEEIIKQAIDKYSLIKKKKKNK